MMKKFVFFALLLMGFSMMSNAQSMKMVVDKRGNVVGRYVETDRNVYYISVQDVVSVPKSGHRIVTFSAAKGQGVVFYDQAHTGNLNVRKSPSTNSAILTQIPEPGDYVPECYNCLGKVNGWYKVRVNGKVGYVRGDLLEWDGMCTF